ncbi:MAG: hypothetical protein KIS96_01215 [Bauldia sp.]|nr:hypothetical protein [Bauldia sp.]
MTYPLGRRLRELVEATIEDLIGFLDSIAPDPDLEPSLGSYPYWGATEPDLEGDGADDEPGGDDEPSLGSLDRMPNQERWSDGNGGSWLLDAEAEHDGREDDELEDDGFDESREVAA